MKNILERKKKMPEIAEVETVRRTLNKNILNKKIVDIKVLYPKMIENDIDYFKKNLINKSFININRRGKWLIFELSDFYLISHLRMEGKYFIKLRFDKIEKHEHVIFTFDDNSTLRYHDTRKFGRMKLILKEEFANCEEINKQGYEPMDKNLTKEYLFQKLGKKNIAIKTALLDQTIISGLGNIYVDEVLFLAQINPLRIAKNINIEECQKIIDAANKIIPKAIIEGGTTIKSYTSSLGVIGNYQNYLLVHKKENKPCVNCNTLIKRVKVNGRSTYYCPNCQK